MILLFQVSNLINYHFFINLFNKICFQFQVNYFNYYIFTILIWFDLIEVFNLKLLQHII